MPLSICKTVFSFGAISIRLDSLTTEDWSSTWIMNLTSETFSISTLAISEFSKISTFFALRYEFVSSRILFSSPMRLFLNHTTVLPENRDDLIASLELLSERIRVTGLWAPIEEG